MRPSAASSESMNSARSCARSTGISSMVVTAAPDQSLPLDRKIFGSGALAINRFHLVVESLDDRERQHACDEFGGHADLISDDNREPPHTVPVECDFPYRTGDAIPRKLGKQPARPKDFADTLQCKLNQLRTLQGFRENRTEKPYIARQLRARRVLISIDRKRIALIDCPTLLGNE